MKQFVVLLMLGVILSSCASSSKLLRRGDYDAAIAKAVKKLHKNLDNHNEIRTLERAYTIANEQNNERIRFLQLDGNPRYTSEILHLYDRMKKRQTLVRTVLPLNLPDRVVQFPYVDYDEEIINAKSGAAEYHYSQALRQMERNEKEAFRLAWNNLLTVKELAGDYKDVNSLLLDARQKGISRVLVGVTNRTHLNLSPEFVMQLLTVDYSSIDNQWVEFHYMDIDGSLSYDYFVDINLLSVLVSSDQTNVEDRMVRKRVEDGFEYVLDARGNVVKDSLGNDVKMTKYKDLACTVVETKQRKTVSIEGNLELFSELPRRLLKREPIVAATEFKHFSARAIGDLAALDEETRKLIAVKPLPFPTEGEMVYRTAETMRVAIAAAIRKNRRLIK